MRRYLPGVAAAVLGMVAAGVGVGSVEGVAVQNSRFSDVAADHYAAVAVERAAEVGFCPGEPIERWVMAVWLTRVVDNLEPGQDPALDQGRQAVSLFVDVDPVEWWAPYVERIAQLGVTTGCASEPARFCPYEAVTRAQMASFLARAFNLETDVAPADFVDVDGVHANNIDAVAAAGVTMGCGANLTLLGSGSILA